MPITTSPRTLRTAAIAASSLAIGLAAMSPSGAGAAPGGAAAPSAPVAAASGAAPADAAIPYLTVLQPLAVRQHAQIVRGRIQLRALIGADGLKTTWSIRTITHVGGRTVYHVVAHGTAAPGEEAKPASAVVYGTPHSIVHYDVTATNAAGGLPTPQMSARIA
jgi:hypothetical protein